MAIGPTIIDIREITAVLSEILKMDYSNYAFSFLRRRFAFLFDELKVKNASSFIQEIKNGTIIDDFCYFFPVEENEMFRDPSFWRTLRGKILPDLEEGNLSFWFPELVSAEELFSLIVILEEENLMERAKIYCNVYSNRRISQIKQGEVNNKNLELNKNNYKRLELRTVFENHFVEGNGNIRLVNENWINQVEFLQGNFFNVVPAENIGVTLFRNRMLYYNSKLQSDAEQHLKRSLNKDAFLVMGIKEKLLKEHEHDFVLFDSSEQIYRVS
ncbi:CheR family methyltransferase [Saccharicrinis sp. 156]|uniref:CheR family methyltransferase n=1 Tax=Saccharicrinis sp. 156 TaxID=3417574 RepID=UPI003D357FAA